MERRFDDWAEQAGRVKEFFEQLKGEVSPDLILTHYKADLHQDHRLLCELTWNTFRDHAILEYEIPKYDGDLGRPNAFVPLSAEQAVAKALAQKEGIFTGVSGGSTFAIAMQIAEKAAPVPCPTADPCSSFERGLGNEALGRRHEPIETVDDDAEYRVEQPRLRGPVREGHRCAVDELEQLVAPRPCFGVDREEDALVLADRDVADRQPIRQDFLQAAFGQDRRGGEIAVRLATPVA